MYWIMTEDGWKLWLPSYKVCENHNKLEGVFRDQSLQDAQKETAAHADHYVDVINKYLNGEFKGSGAERWNEAKSRIAQFKLYGAFGEKL